MGEKERERETLLSLFGDALTPYEIAGFLNFVCFHQVLPAWSEVYHMDELGELASHGNFFRTLYFRLPDAMLGMEV